MTTSCLIPLYNEGERIFVVLDCLFKVKGLTEIIVIDDASTININQKLKEKYPNLKLLRFEKNHGKTGAIIEGLKVCSAENILLFDSDLFNINQKQLEKAVDYFSSHSDIDMIILRRINDTLFYRIIRSDTVISGQRLLRTKDLQAIIKTSFKNFQLEVAINDYMIKHQKIVGWLPLSCQDVRKTAKFGLIKGTIKDWLMILELLSYKGSLYYFKVLFSFCRKEIKITD